MFGPVPANLPRPGKAIRVRRDVLRFKLISGTSQMSRRSVVDLEELTDMNPNSDQFSLPNGGLGHHFGQPQCHPPVEAHFSGFETAVTGLSARFNVECGTSQLCGSNLFRT